MRSLGMVLAALALGYLVWCLVLYTQQRRMLFPGTALGPADYLPDRAEVWQHVHDEGRVEALFWPAPGATARRPAPLVVLAHGNFELAADFGELARAYNDEGWHVLAPEYRGYGASQGEPTAEGITEDFGAFLERALARDDVRRPVVYHGRSLGGGVMTHLAREHPPAALVLESSFTSVADMARPYMVPTALLRDRFDSLAFVRSFDGPVLVLHGTRDEVIPPGHGDRLASAAGVDPVRMPCGHNDCRTERGEPWARIRGLLERAQDRSVGK